MRKLLLASVATLGATLAMSGGAKAQPVKPVAPGTLVVHLNGYMQFELGAVGSTYNQVNTYSSTAPGYAYTGTYKSNPVSTIGDFRIYPGFDAQTVNGLDYGVATDIRTGYSDAGTGQGGKTTVTATTVEKGTTTTYTTTTTLSNTDGLYVKRAYGYAGSPIWGYVRFGQTDSAFTLLQDGVIEAFGDGGQWTLEGGEAVMFPSNAAPAGGNQFIYADQSPVYSTDKVVYISPAYFGFNIVGGYEPNSNGLKEGYDSCSGGGSTCAGLSASPVPADVGKRRQNTYDFGLQYVAEVGGVKIKASGVYLDGQPVNYDGPIATGAAGGAGGTSPTKVGTAVHAGYDNLEVYQFGASATFAGLTVGANIKGGQTLDGYAFQPKGDRDALAYIIGADYVLGPYVIGASYFNSQTAGAAVPGLVETVAPTAVSAGYKTTVGRTLSEYGLAVGGNYVVSPNFSVFAQYLYGHRHQLGNPVLLGTAYNGNRGNTQVQAIGFGATLKW